MKTCRTCKKEKPISEYYKHTNMADGHLNICKTCTRNRVTLHRELNIERIREYDRLREHRPARKASKRRKRIYSLVQRAVAKKELIRKPCQVCGNPKTEAHHTNYNKPLEVVHLCVVHHRRLHAGKFSLFPRIEAFTK